MKNTTIELTDELVNGTPVIQQAINEPNMFLIVIWLIILLAGLYAMFRFIRTK